MSEKELKEIWKGTVNSEQINFDLTQLETDLKTKTAKLHRTLFFRDAREIIVAIIVIVFFAYKAYGENIQIVKFANILIAAWAVYIVYRLLDVRKYKHIGDLSTSFKAELLRQKFYLQQQAHLLDSVLYWYIAPPAVFGVISIIGRAYGIDYSWSSVGSWQTLTSLAIICLISWGIYALNKKAAKTTYTPLIKNIDSILLQLDEDSI